MMASLDKVLPIEKRLFILHKAKKTILRSNNGHKILLRALALTVMQLSSNGLSPECLQRSGLINTRIVKQSKKWDQYKKYDPFL